MSDEVLVSPDDIKWLLMIASTLNPEDYTGGARAVVHKAKEVEARAMEGGECRVQLDLWRMR